MDSGCEPEESSAADQFPGEDGQPSQHGGNTTRQTIRSDMVFERHAMTDDFEPRTVDRAQLPCVEGSA